ncbi:MAG: PPC domain-containing protein [Sandaracinaceae bacterium]|nr:PPC domain-containing protein [Sandaracinaceae bacterium]
MIKLSQLALVAAAVVGFVGCSKPEPINETHQGTIEASDPTLDVDHSHYDAYDFTAAEGATITITCTSSAMDAYAHLIDKEGNQLAHDDDSAGGTNARVTFTAPYTGAYKAYANTAGATETGAYTLTIVTTAGH